VPGIFLDYTNIGNYVKEYKTMIAKYPALKKLEIKDKRYVESYIKNYLPYSDFNFVSLHSYNTQRKLKLSILNDNLVVLFTDYLTQKQFFSFIGKNRTVETALTLLNDANKRGFLPYLKLIPEGNLDDALRESAKVKVCKDVNNFDYVLSIENLAINSKKFHKKKDQLYRKFDRECPDKVVSTLNLKDKTVQREILKLFKTWAGSKNNSTRKYKNELKAIKKLIASPSLLKVYAIGIFLNKKMIGFAAASFAHDNYADFHFVKADPLHKGIFSALYIYLAQHLYIKGYKYLNIQQDLGIPGLRKSKMLWRPVKFLKKYKISLRNEG
jgi:uncharacterized protein